MKIGLAAIFLTVIGMAATIMYEWIHLYIPWLGPFLLSIGILGLTLTIVFWNKIPSGKKRSEEAPITPLVSLSPSPAPVKQPETRGKKGIIEGQQKVIDGYADNLRHSRQKIEDLERQLKDKNNASS